MIFWNLSRNGKPVIKEVDKMNNEIKIFEGNQIRSVWDNDKEEWYFSVVDVVGTLTDSKDPGAYWRKLKQRLKEEGSEVVTFCHGLKLKAADGKMRESDVADMQGIFRIIQSVPSPKAEPFKMWLAEVGKERLDEIIDPELTIDRALETYFKGRVLTGVDEPKTSGNSGKKRAYRRLAGSWNKRRHGVCNTYQRDFQSLVWDDHKRI